MDNYDVYPDENKGEEWVNLTEPVFSLEENNSPDEAQKESVDQEKSVHRDIKSPILTLQLTITLLIMIALLLIKSFIPELYFKFRHFYDNEMSLRVYSDGDFASLDYSEFFASTTDEAKYD